MLQRLQHRVTDAQRECAAWPWAALPATATHTTPSPSNGTTEQADEESSDRGIAGVDAMSAATLAESVQLVPGSVRKASQQAAELSTRIAACISRVHTATEEVQRVAQRAQKLRSEHNPYALSEDM